MKGVVLHGTGGAWHVHCEDGSTVVAALRGRVKHESGIKLAVGDEVTVRRDEGSDWTIAEILPHPVVRGRDCRVGILVGLPHSERQTGATTDVCQAILDEPLAAP